MTYEELNGLTLTHNDRTALNSYVNKTTTKITGTHSMKQTPANHDRGAGFNHANTEAAKHGVKLP